MHDAHDALRGIDLNLVLALDALLAERHVTRAAHRLGITQPAASHALARLRQLFGDPLLVRGPRGAMLATPRGEQLAPLVHDVLVDLAAVVHGTAFDPATAKRTFRIGGSDYVELVLLPKLIERIGRLAARIDGWGHAFDDYGDEEPAPRALRHLLPPAVPSHPPVRYEKG